MRSTSSSADPRFVAQDKLPGCAIVRISYQHKHTKLRLAKRTARLGTETAFEVLVKRKRSKHRGATSFILKSESPIRTRANHRADATHCVKASHTTGLRPAMMELREVIAQSREQDAPGNVTPASGRRPGGKPIISFPFWSRRRRR